MEKIFKAQRLDTGEWRVFYLTDLIDGSDDFLCLYDIDKKTICQYTGINDSQGHRIFEGDELDFDPVEWGGPHKFYIKYDKFNAEFTGSGTPQNWTQFCTLTGHNIHDKD